MAQPGRGPCPEDTQTHRPWTPNDAKKDPTCSRLTRARGEHRRGDPQPSTRGGSEVIFRFLPLSFPIIFSYESRLKPGLGESRTNKRNTHPTGESGSLEILPVQLSKQHTGDAKSRDQLWCWKPNLGSQEVPGQGPLRWSPGDAAIPLRVGTVPAPSKGAARRPSTLGTSAQKHHGGRPCWVPVCARGKKLGRREERGCRGTPAVSSLDATLLEEGLDRGFGGPRLLGHVQAVDAQSWCRGSPSPPGQGPWGVSDSPTPGAEDGEVFLQPLLGLGEAARRGL